MPTGTSQRTSVRSTATAFWTLRDSCHLADLGGRGPVACRHGEQGKSSRPVVTRRRKESAMRPNARALDHPVLSSPRASRSGARAGHDQGRRIRVKLSLVLVLLAVTVIALMVLPGWGTGRKRRAARLLSVSSRAWRVSCPRSRLDAAASSTTACTGPTSGGVRSTDRTAAPGFARRAMGLEPTTLSLGSQDGHRDARQRTATNARNQAGLRGLGSFLPRGCVGSV